MDFCQPYQSLEKLFRDIGLLPRRRCCSPN